MNPYTTFSVPESCTSNVNPGAQTQPSFSVVWAQMQKIVHDGPVTASDWRTYELLKWARRDLDAKYITFSGSNLTRSICLKEYAFTVEFCREMESLIQMLPITDGQNVERDVLMDLICEAAKQCGMSWSGEAWARSAIVFGIMEACAVERRNVRMQDTEELGHLMAGTDLNDQNLMDCSNVKEALLGIMQM